MKQIIFMILSVSILASCSNSEENIVGEKPEITQTPDDGLYREYYPNDQVKMEGALNEEGKRMGKWTAYFENGQKMSESMYNNGQNHGYSMVWYPNGNVRYFGDYKAGKKTGEWTFYKESGEVLKLEEY